MRLWSQDKLLVALCALRPPTGELWVPSKRPTFPFCPVNHIPIGHGKLAQEGRAFAPKRTSTNFLASGRKIALASPPCGSAMERSREKRLRGRQGEVPLDVAETKSEDCQVDAGGNKDRSKLR